MRSYNPAVLLPFCAFRLGGFLYSGKEFFQSKKAVGNKEKDSSKKDKKKKCANGLAHFFLRNIPRNQIRLKWQCRQLFVFELQPSPYCKSMCVLGIFSKAISCFLPFLNSKNGIRKKETKCY